MRPPWLALLLVSCGGAAAPVSHDGLPAGTIVAFAGPRPPDGWLACDGAIVARDAYPALYAAIGDTWGAGDGRTTFGLPDLRGRSPVGAGLAAFVASGAGGASAGVMSGGVGYALSPATPAKTGLQLGETGGGRPVSLQPPSAAVTWLVRY